MRKKKFLIGGLVVLIAIIYLLYTGFSSSATYYYTVSELLAQRETITGENVRVNGEVVADSIQSEAAELTLKFDVVEAGTSLPVQYRGAVPDTFQGGREVVVEGHLNTEGVFEAKTILTKCPSKYEPEEIVPAGEK